MKAMQLHPVVQDSFVKLSSQDVSSNLACGTLSAKLRSNDLQVWVGTFEKICGRPPFAGSLTDRVVDLAVFQHSFDAAVDRTAEVTLEMRPWQGKSVGKKNELVGGFVANGELDRVLKPMLGESLQKAFQRSSQLSGCGTFVFKNIMNVLAYQMPSAAFSGEITNLDVAETWCGAGTNGTDYVAAALSQPTASVSEVSEYYLNLPVFRDVREANIVVIRGGVRLKLPVSTQTLRFLQKKAWVRQLSACKAMQVVKMVAKDGVVARPRKIPKPAYNCEALLKEILAKYRPSILINLV
jgi:hypothetical protein